MSDRRFSCRRCRFVLFDEEHLMPGHIQDLDYTLFLRLEDNFLPEWIQQAIEEVCTSVDISLFQDYFFDGAQLNLFKTGMV